MNVGDSFIWFPPNGMKEHLYIVMTNPADHGGRFAAINLTQSHHGPNAITFRIGEHPFITRYDSDANIGDALIMDELEIQNQMRFGQAVAQQPMNMHMVERIALAAIGHPAISEEAEDLIKSEWT
jgi:hypothetical protein